MFTIENKPFPMSMYRYSQLILARVQERILNIFEQCHGWSRLVSDRTVGNDHFCDTTEMDSPRLNPPCKGGDPLYHRSGDEPLDPTTLVSDVSQYAIGGHPSPPRHSLCTKAAFRSFRSHASPGREGGPATPCLGTRLAGKSPPK